MTTIQHTNNNANGCVTWREQCARLTGMLAAARALVVGEAAGDADRDEPPRERCVRHVRELAAACAVCVAAETSGDTTDSARLLEHGARLFLQLAATFVADDTAAPFCDDILTRKLFKNAFAACVAAVDSSDITCSTSWCERDTRLSLVQAIAHAAGLAAEALDDETAKNAARVTWGDAHDAQKRLREAHLPEIETAYDEISAALDAEHRSALCSAAYTRSHVRRPAQVRSRARRPRRSRPRCPSASSEGDGEGPPAARCDGGAPNCQTQVACGERSAP